MKSVVTQGECGGDGSVGKDEVERKISLETL